MSRSQVESLFQNSFQKQPEWVIRCPGRVNLIGEHIDYSGYSVLPMAIQESTYLAVGIADQTSENAKQLNFVSVEPEKYESASCALSSLLPVQTVSSAPCPLKWYHYFVAGWRRVIQKLVADYPELQIHGLNIAVGSSIPPNAGLSSSSALVSAATLATLAIQDPQFDASNFDKTQLADLAISAERYVGTEGGGMDQALVHSNTEMNKANSSHYNERVVECRIAAQILCKKGGKLAEGQTEWSSVRTLKQAEHMFGFEQQPQEMLKYVEELLEKEDKSAHSRQEVCDILGIQEADLAKHSLNNNTQQMTHFWLAKRARHVYSEAARVFAFEEICNQQQAKKGDSTQEEVLSKLGKLMNQSHQSCQLDFQCSSPELDLAVQKCLSCGCLGARLTGAGWGGCAVALVDSKERQKMLAKDRPDQVPLDVLFWTEPSQGIEAFKSL
uniref:Galactokinase n=1 Tax=Ditylenchus dipsaci TaxID=166011 RepID=A0A915DEF4_9BILA